MITILNNFFDNLLGSHTFDVIFNGFTIFTFDYSLITSLVILISLLGVFVSIIKCLIRWCVNVFKLRD